MDAYNLLLGRHWLHDNYEIHDGDANAYAFKHKGYVLTLAHYPT